MKTTSYVLLCLIVACGPVAFADEPAASPTVELSGEQLRDKIRGGLLGQMLGNLNGLKHEMKYIHEPGNVVQYTPGLPNGAFTDDDTDFEWVYVLEMQRANTILLPPQRIAQLWKSRINRRIWCSNEFARQLMDLGLEPPLTGRFALNPWADFNISGQFLCETFGLIAPAMPQTAGRIGLNYTTVAIDLEPAQSTQLFTAMIATAFTTNSLDAILDAGVSATDPQSDLREIVADVRKWHKQYSDDWRTTRRLVKKKYSRHNGGMRDRNGYELITASTIAALLYGQGDPAKTLMTAFNFGWDADNSAATAGTIVGVMKGYRWMLAQGWSIVDRYRNTTRQEMPTDETITGFADRLIDLAEKVIIDGGGQRLRINGRTVYRIRTEKPGNIMPLPNLDEQTAQMRKSLKPKIEAAMTGKSSAQQRAQAAYLAICLDLSGEMQTQHPTVWAESIKSLGRYENVLQAIYYQANVPRGSMLRKRATAAGLKRPAERKKLWE